MFNNYGIGPAGLARDVTKARRNPEDTGTAAGAAVEESLDLISRRNDATNAECLGDAVDSRWAVVSRYDQLSGSAI